MRDHLPQSTLPAIRVDREVIQRFLSQHFFALQLTHQDVDALLDDLANASVVIDTTNPQIVSNGEPEDVLQKVSALGVKSKNTAIQRAGSL